MCGIDCYGRDTPAEQEVPVLSRICTLTSPSQAADTLPLDLHPSSFYTFSITSVVLAHFCSPGTLLAHQPGRPNLHHTSNSPGIVLTGCCTTALMASPLHPVHSTLSIFSSPAPSALKPPVQILHPHTPASQQGPSLLYHLS